MATEVSNPVAESAPQTPSRNKSRLLKNILTSAVSFGLSIVAGLLFTPFALKKVGDLAYGYVPLATAIVSYFAILATSFNVAVARSLTVALEQADKVRANAIFNASIAISTIFAGVVLVLTALGLASLDHILSVPKELLGPVKILMVMTLAGFAVSVLRSPFEVSTFCKNRFDLRSLSSATELVVRIGLCVVLFLVATPSLAQVGYGILAASVASGVLAIIFWRSLTPELKFQPRSAKLSEIVPVLPLFGWTALNQVGAILFLSVDLVVVNRVLGPAEVTPYSLCLNWVGVVRGLALAISGVFGPPLIYMIARDDMEGATAYSRRAVRILGVAMTVITGTVCGLATPLLHVWVGGKYTAYAPLLILLVAHLGISTAVFPLNSLLTAANRVKWPGLVTLGLGLVNLALSIVLAGPCHWGVYGVAAGGTITFLIKNLIFTPIYAATATGAPKGLYLRDLGPLFILTIVVTGGAWMMAQTFKIGSWTALFGFGAVYASICLVAGYALLVGSEDRKALAAILARFMPSRSLKNS